MRLPHSYLSFFIVRLPFLPPHATFCSPLSLSTQAVNFLLTVLISHQFPSCLATIAEATAASTAPAAGGGGDNVCRGPWCPCCEVGWAGRERKKDPQALHGRHNGGHHQPHPSLSPPASSDTAGISTSCPLCLMSHQGAFWEKSESHWNNSRANTCANTARDHKPGLTQGHDFIKCIFMREVLYVHWHQRFS